MMNEREILTELARQVPSLVSRVSLLVELPEDGSWAMRVQDCDDYEFSHLARRIDGSRYIGVMPLLYTHRVIIGDVTDETGYEDGFCYHDAPSAIIAATLWDGTGEPTGWHRHPFFGRRRPDGDPAQEYVNL